tara:strand:- start:147 stop:293 length:147 start_codon:yes stop_codon:yes gene_type:complete
MLTDMLQQLNPNAVVTVAEDCVIIEITAPDPAAQEAEANTEVRPDGDV